MTAQRHRGFTLLELIIVLALLALLSALAIPALQDVRAPSSISPVDASLAALDPATIAFRPSTRMRFARPERVRVLVSPTLSAEELTAELRRRGGGEGSVTTEEIRVAPEMEARLTGDAFDITPITPQRQAVAESVTTEWSWNVTPRKGGTQRLYLAVDAILSIGGDRVPRSIRVLERAIQVEITPRERVQAFVTANWQFIVGTFALPFALWLWKKRSSSTPPSAPPPAPAPPRGEGRFE